MGTRAMMKLCVAALLALLTFVAAGPAPHGASKTGIGPGDQADRLESEGRAANIASHNKRAQAERAMAAKLANEDADEKKREFQLPHHDAMAFGRKEPDVPVTKVPSQTFNGFQAKIAKPYGASKDWPRGGPGDTPSVMGGRISGPGISQPLQQYY